MSEVRIAAEPRTEFGKGGARRTRRAGKVPAVLYGHGTPPRHIALPLREFAHALRGGGGSNVLLRLDLDGGSELALPKSVQRDPVRGDIEHVDLLLVRSGEKVTVEVPVVLSGEAVAGTLVDQQHTTIALQAEATHIPESVEVSIDGADVGTSISAGDLTLPAGTTLQADPALLVVHVTAAPTAEQLEAELTGAEAEVGIAHEAPSAAQGAGDVVPDTDSGEGGPSRSPAETAAASGSATG